jgi:hypothetical protein
MGNFEKSEIIIQYIKNVGKNHFYFFKKLQI